MKYLLSLLVFLVGALGHLNTEAAHAPFESQKVYSETQFFGKSETLSSNNKEYQGNFTSSRKSEKDFFLDPIEIEEEEDEKINLGKTFIGSHSITAFSHSQVVYYATNLFRIITKRSSGYPFHKNSRTLLFQVFRL